MFTLALKKITKFANAFSTCSIQIFLAMRFILFFKISFSFACHLNQMMLSEVKKCV